MVIGVHVNGRMVRVNGFFSPSLFFIAFGASARPKRPKNRAHGDVNQFGSIPVAVLMHDWRTTSA